MKKLLLIIGIPLLVIVIAVAALLLFVDPNQFKPLIVEQTKKQTGMDLVIEGDIGWQVFPSLGLSLGKTELKNPTGFKNANLLKIEGIDVDVSVMPLFSKELFIGNVSLDGAEIYIETRKDGSSNLDALTQKSASSNSTSPTESANEPASTQPEAATTQESQQPWTINLAGVSITNALLEMQDDSTGTYTKLYDVGLSVSEFEFSQWTTAIFAAKGKNNQQNFSAQGQAEFKLMQDLANYELRNISLDSSFSDPSTTISSAKIELATFAFDKENALNLSVKGNAADLAIDLSLQSKLLIDTSINHIRLNNMQLDSSFVGSSLPQSPMKITAKSEFGFDVKQSLISLELQALNLNDIQLDGKTTVKLNDIPQIRFDLHSPNIDVDQFLGLDKPASTTASTQESNQPAPTNTPTATANTEPATEVEPDLSALKTLDVKGKVTIDKFKANNAKMQNVVTNFTVNRGVADLNSFTSNLYQGSIQASAQLDARKSPASYWAKKNIKDVKIQPLLKDVADNDMLEGTGNINVDVSGKSLTPTGIKQNLSGTVKIDFGDGAVNGINVAQLIRVNYAKIKGNKVDEDAKEQKKTDFSALKATLALSKGVMTTNDLNVSSPLLRIHGKGNTNYINETMDFLLDTSVVGSLKGQGGKDINDLKDITIPVRVYNKWVEPKYKIEFDQLWKQLEKEKKKELEKKAEKELDRFLGDKLKDEGTKELADKLLKGLFN